MQFPDFPLPIDPFSLTVGGLQLIPAIVFILQIAKSYFKNLPGDAWRGAALVLGILGVFASQYDAGTLPTTATGIIALLIIGLIVGKLAHEGYDKVLRKLAPMIFQSMENSETPVPGDPTKHYLNLSADMLWSGAHLQPRATAFIVGDDGREYELSVNTDGQVVAFPISKDEDSDLA